MCKNAPAQCDDSGDMKTPLEEDSSCDSHDIHSA